MFHHGSIAVTSVNEHLTTFSAEVKLFLEKVESMTREAIPPPTPADDPFRGSFTRMQAHDLLGPCAAR